MKLATGGYPLKVTENSKNLHLLLLLFFFFFFFFFLGGGGGGGGAQMCKEFTISKGNTAVLPHYRISHGGELFSIYYS